MLSHLGMFVLSHCKRIMNNFVHEIKGYCSNKTYYQDTDSLERPMDEKLREADFVENDLGQ